jgi:hypothetical protein
MEPPPFPWNAGIFTGQEIGYKWFPIETKGPWAMRWIPQTELQRDVYVETFEATQGLFDPASGLGMGIHVTSTPPLLSTVNKPVASGSTGYQSFGYIRAGDNKEIVLWDSSTACLCSRAHEPTAAVGHAVVY